MKRFVLTSGLAALTLLPATALGAGFEVGDNTALSNGRGGTGVVSKSDPSATTYNPGRLPFVDGYQLELDSSLVDLNLTFQRDPLERPSSTQEFEAVSNEGHPFPVPYFATTWDLGVENLTVGFSASGPHAYGSRCFSEVEDGECVVDFENAARHMVVSTNLLQIYFLASVGYAFELSGGTLGVGVSAGPGWQKNDLTLVVDQIGGSVGAPYLEDPNTQAVFATSNLQALEPVGIIGLAWEGDDGIRFGASYRPPIIWEAEGQVDLRFPEALDGLVELTDDALTLRVPQAHSLKFGWGYAGGEHPGDPDRPRFDFETNIVWENWSILDAFETDPKGAILIADVQEQELSPVVQPKGYIDTFALRIGGSWAAAKFASLHLGGFLETPAQKNSVTNVDFVSWERVAGSLGATYHFGKTLDVTLSYTYVHSPARTVSNGAVYSQIPLSRCTYPDYDQESCAQPGVPPGNPQNNGEWRNSFHIPALGLRLRI